MPWKLYIDSRKRVAGARGDSDSDFAVALPYPITVSGKAYVDVCLLANSFYTIRTGENDRIYLDELAAQTKRVVMLAAGQYNVYELRDALLNALNAGTALAGQYSVAYAPTRNRFQVGIVNPAATDEFRIWSERQLRADAAAWAAFASADDLRSANRPCGFLDGTFTVGSNMVSGTAPNAPDAQPYKQLFLRSNLSSSHESLGVNGETDIIRRIVVGNAGKNDMIHDAHSLPFDCVRINGSPELNQLWFQLVDVDGRVVDTHGHPVSFSIIFQDVEE